MRKNIKSIKKLNIAALILTIIHFALEIAVIILIVGAVAAAGESGQSGIAALFGIGMGAIIVAISYIGIHIALFIIGIIMLAKNKTGLKKPGSVKANGIILCINFGIGLLTMIPIIGFFISFISFGLRIAIIVLSSISISHCNNSENEESENAHPISYNPEDDE